MDITPTSVHLPIEIWIANAELVHEAFETDGGDVVKPRIQNLKDIQDNGTALGEFLDDQTHMFQEPKDGVDIPVLSAVGPKLRDVKMLSGAEEVMLPINAFTYAIYAIMQGLDPATSIVNDADVRFDNAGYTDPDVPNPTYDKIATMLDRQESIETVRFCLLAQVQPADPSLGDKFILCTKLSVDMEQVQQMIQKQYYQQTIALKSVILTDAELTRWQNIVPAIKKSIGLYSFHMDTPET